MLVKAGELWAAASFEHLLETSTSSPPDCLWFSLQTDFAALGLPLWGWSGKTEAVLQNYRTCSCFGFNSCSLLAAIWTFECPLNDGGPREESAGKMNSRFSQNSNFHEIPSLPSGCSSAGRVLAHLQVPHPVLKRLEGGRVPEKQTSCHLHTEKETS